MNFIKYITLVTILIMLSSCESIVDDINENPNQILAEDVEPQLYLTGALLANSSAQVGHLNRISGMYSGQLIGFTSLYGNIYGFNLSTVESATTWSRIYVGAVTNLRTMREAAPDDNLLVGISKVVEAHAIGTAASLFGNIPYSEIGDPEISDPNFDSQVAVFNDLLTLLDQAISDLQSASSRQLDSDIYFGGDANKWIEAAYTLQARYHLQMGNYGAALTAAQNGISSEEGSMKYIPRGVSTNSEGDKNLFWTILEGSRSGDIGTGNSYLMQLIDPSSGISRNNAKTDETARFRYFTIDESGGSANEGIIEQFEPQYMVSYAENQLILAETATREIGFSEGLSELNVHRAWLDSGGRLNENFDSEPYNYDAYVAADFAPGGMENGDSIDPTQALLREIFEERYVSGFGMYMPFNDARRLRVTDPDIAVPFVMVDGPNPPFAERLPYSDEELNANENAPSEDPGIFTKTEVNQ